MKKILFLFSFILLKILAGCAHNTPNSNFNTPITLPIETINDLIAKDHHKGNVLSESENYVVPFAAGSIAATQRDLIKYFLVLMSGRLLSQGSLQIMFSIIICKKSGLPKAQIL